MRPLSLVEIVLAKQREEIWATPPIVTTKIERQIAAQNKKNDRQRLEARVCSIGACKKPVRYTKPRLACNAHGQRWREHGSYSLPPRRKRTAVKKAA